MNKSLFVILLLMMFMGTVLAQNFAVPITIQDDVNTFKITIGMSPSATDGFDAIIDTLLPGAGPAGTFDARETWNNDDYKRDIRASSLTQKTYYFSYRPEAGREPIIISWNPATLAALGTFIITDNITGTLFTLDMSTTNSLNTGENAFVASSLRILVTAAPPPALNANFIGTPTFGTYPLRVQFTDQSTPGAGTITSRSWYFGVEGFSSTAQNPVFVYWKEGSYDVRLIVQNSLGERDTLVRTNYINTVSGPSANFTSNVTTGPAPLSVSFSNTSATGTAPITSYLWSFGDGGTSTLENPTHVYSSVGQYTVRLIVTDGNAFSDTLTRVNYIYVTNGAAPEFQTVLNVSDGVNDLNLTFGYHPNGTAGFDLGLDILAPPAPPAGGFDARLRSANEDFAVDFRPQTQGETVFTVLYAAEAGAGPIVLSWNPSLLDQDYSFRIVDNVTGLLFPPLDMSTTNSLTITDPSLASGLRILVAPGKTIRAYLQGPMLPQVTLTPNCTFVCTLKVDMTNHPAPNNYLGSFTGEVYYSGRLTLIGTSPVLSGYTGNVVVNTTNRRISFNGAKVAGTPGVVDIMVLYFTIANEPGGEVLVSPSFSVMASAYTFENLIPKLDVDDYTFNIAPVNLLGDVNGDNLVNSTDALIILSYDAWGGLSQQNLLDRVMAGIGDANGDGLTNSTDALLILSYDVGIQVPVPLGQPVCFN